MKLADLARELNIPNQSFLKFIRDFDLDLSECIKTNFDVKEDFERFARENVAFLRRYAEDLEASKSVEEIAENINQPSAKVAEVISKEKPVLYENGRYKASVSSFGIDNKLGGNYQFVYNYFGKNTKLTQRDFIGYQDLFYFISESLEPFLNNISVQNWGIHRPAGIVLYGPPGSGKIFWAHKIAEIIGFNFTEINSNYLGENLQEAPKYDFREYINNLMKQPKTLLFLDNFDRFMMPYKDDDPVDFCDEKSKQIILHYISHFEEQRVLMVGSASSLRKIDPELFAPGRFDLLIPVFPPNVKERTELLLFHMTKELVADATLLQILKHNNAHLLPFWQQTAAKMKVYSNTMVVDFTQSLKKRLRNIYTKNNSVEIEINANLLESAFKDASAKLTDRYLDEVQVFVQDVSRNNFADFQQRIDQLKTEINYYKIPPKQESSIGFRHSEQDKK